MFFSSKKSQEQRKLVQVVTKVKKGKRGLKLDGNFTIYLSNFVGSDWRWEIPTKTYIAYKARKREYHNCFERYWRFVTPHDVYMNEIANDLSEKIDLTRDEGKSRYAQIALDFVHRFPYQNRDLTYVKYPLETLCENGGNCVDNSVLLATLLKIKSIDCCFIILPQHLLVGINLPLKGAYTAINEKKYYFAEAVSAEWQDNSPNLIGDPLSYSLKEAEFSFPSKL
jgi:transglutaminase-like putative cysteine protease